jgi:hypothetical protein
VPMFTWGLSRLNVSLAIVLGGLCGLSVANFAPRAAGAHDRD